MVYNNIDQYRLLSSEGGERMQFITVKEASEKWGYSEDRIRRWCREGKIKLVAAAIKISGRWQIPSDAECPDEPKIKNKK